MKKNVFWCVLIGFSLTLTHAQRHEIGILVGGVNYIGEVGNTQYFNPKHLGYGFIYKRNFNDRISLRVQFSTGDFSGNDRDSTNPFRKDREYTFSNTFNALGVGLEVNYVPLPIGDFGTSWTPFLHVGIQRMIVDDLYFMLTETTAWSQGRNMTISVPFGVGVKFNLGQYWVIAAEVQPQFTLTDNLDGSFPDRSKQPSATPFSTSLSSDWLVFSGISITYAFGRLPCCR